MYDTGCVFAIKKRKNGEKLMIISLISLLRFLYRVLGEKNILFKSYKAIILWVFLKNDFNGLDRKSMEFYIKKLSKDLRVSERVIEYPWVLSRGKELKDKIILDVGCRKGLPTTDLLSLNNQLFGIDPDITETIDTSEFKIIKGDIRATNFQDSFFDQVFIVSTLEHIGIEGRYHLSIRDEDGDIYAMKEISRILKSGGKVLGTVPYGQGMSLPLNRLYNHERLEKLFSFYKIIEINYYKYFNKYGLWLEVDEDIAAKNDWDTETWYSLACFSLEKL